MKPVACNLLGMEFSVAKIMEGLDLTMDKFIDMCILCGCEYCDSIKSIGPHLALKRICQHVSLKQILENLNTTKYQLPETWDL